MRTKTIPGLVTAVLAAAAVLGACFSERVGVAEPASKELCTSPTASTVQIRNYAFGGGEIRVARGTRVTWVNCDTQSHTSTSDAAGWNSGLLAPSATFSRVFDQPGRYTYHCDPHPFMKGTVVVE